MRSFSFLYKNENKIGIGLTSKPQAHRLQISKIKADIYGAIFIFLNLFI
jgi:hypothetical protein